MAGAPHSMTAAKDLGVVEPEPFDCVLDGYAYIPRMLDKARATLAGTQGRYLFGCPVDHTCMARLGVTPELVLELAAAHDDDRDVLDALRSHGIPSAEEAWFDGQAVEEGAGDLSPRAQRRRPRGRRVRRQRARRARHDGVRRLGPGLARARNGRGRRRRRRRCDVLPRRESGAHRACGASRSHPGVDLAPLRRAREVPRSRGARGMKFVAGTEAVDLGSVW